MSNTPHQKLLDALLCSWERSNKVLLNLLHALPEGGLAAQATEGSPTVSSMFMHMHHERLVSLSEEVPESLPQVPEQEWTFELDPNHISKLLVESADLVSDAVAARIQSDRSLDLNFGHPLHLIQFLIFHEGYHHGQIKLALKLSGIPISDAVAGPATWDVWRTTE